jgi:hypothetical protein
MERELESKIYFAEDYCSKENMEEHIKEYIRSLKVKYPNAVVTREFYNGQNVLVRATEVYNEIHKKQEQKEKELDDWYIRQRGER